MIEQINQENVVSPYQWCIFCDWPQDGGVCSQCDAPADTCNTCDWIDNMGRDCNYSD